MGMQRTVNSKNNELLAKAGEITAMKAKLFNEEKLIKEKMKKMQKAHDDKVHELNHKINSLQGELTRVRREANNKAKTNVKKNELFPGADKKDLISNADLRPKQNPSRTESPAPPTTAQSSRSQSRSRSRSRSPRSRSRSNSKSISRSKSPKNSKAGSDGTPKNNEEDQSNSRPSSRNSSKSNSPVKEQQRQGDVDSD